MAFGHIRYEVNAPIASVILNRPKQRNAQSRQLLEEMDQALTLATDDDNVKVIVVYGEGDHFSAGHDLGSDDERNDQERRPYPEGVRGRFIRSRDLYVDYSLRWRDIPKPTIAAVQGYCIFGGWIVASSMDMIFAASDAMFLGTNFQYFLSPGTSIHASQGTAIRISVHRRPGSRAAGTCQSCLWSVRSAARNHGLCIQNRRE